MSDIKDFEIENVLKKYKGAGAQITNKEQSEVRSMIKMKVAEMLSNEEIQIIKLRARMEDYDDESYFD